MRIAHITDIHLRSAGRLRPWDLIGQRALGGANLLFNRALEFPPEVPRALFADIDRLKPDHLVISGDLTNLALRAEFDQVLASLRSLALAPAQITVVPGNHDIYTYGSLLTRDFMRLFAPYLKSDLTVDGAVFPLVQLRQDVALIGLSTARPSPPMMAIGTLGSRQLQATRRALRHPEVRRRFRLIVLHHAPLSPPARWHQRLTDAQELIALLETEGADLVVHGHLHRHLVQELPGPNARPVPVIGLTSSTWLGRDPGHRAAYNVYEVNGGGARAEIVRRAYDRDRQCFEEVTQNKIPA